jgi:hypothetical protein
MKWEFMGILDFPEGLQVVAQCVIKDGWLFVMEHPDHTRVYAMYRVCLETLEVKQVSVE